MTENIFENGGEFCMRGDPEHKPVEWNVFDKINDLFPVVYIDHKGDCMRCTLAGRWSLHDETAYDLIPIPSPPKIVPWESLREIPVGIWIRYRDTNVARQIVEYDYESNYVRMIGACESLPSLFHNCEWNIDPHADDGWQPCGKVVK